MLPDEALLASPRNEKVASKLSIANLLVLLQKETYRGLELQYHPRENSDDFSESIKIDKLNEVREFSCTKKKALRPHHLVLQHKIDICIHNS